MKKIDKIDAKILYHLDRDARIADTQLAKLVGRSKESVRYRITKLQEAKIITGFTIWLDPTRLGLHTYKIYFKLANIPEKKRAFITHLTQDSRLFWLGVADGAWDVGCTFFAKSNQEFFEFEQDLLAKFESLILKKYAGVLPRVSIYSKDLFMEESRREQLTLFANPAIGTLDAIEYTLIRELLKDSRASLVYLARSANTSVEIVRTRLRRLEQEKIIAQYRCAIDFTTLGYEFYKTFLYVRKLSQKDLARLHSYIAQHPQIMHLVEQISPWDLEVEIVVHSHKEYNTLINDVRTVFADIIVDIESAIISEDYVFPAQQLPFTPTRGISSRSLS